MKPIDEFLKNFEPNLKSHVIEFGKSLANKEADVFILMARKAACFIECMEILGLTRLNGMVTTDRILDLDLSWLKGKNVVIIDDTIISGTTIHDGLKILDEAKVESAEVMVFCLDEYWHKKELLDFRNQNSLQEPYLKLNHASCLKFCSDIVKALSLFPRPYSIDFPVYPDVRINFSDFQQYFSTTEWDIHDSSSEIQRKNDIQVFALTPSDAITKKFEEFLGFHLSEIAHSKIRFYCREIIRSKEEKTSKQRRSVRKRVRVFYMTKIHPFVLFEPLKETEADRLVDEILSDISSNEKFKSLLRKPSSKLRIIQYYFSAKLLEFWKMEFNDVTGTKLNTKVSQRSLDYIFLTNKKVSPVFKDSLLDLKLEREKGDRKENSKEIRENGINPFILNACLTNEFTKLYHEYELPARRLVKTDGISAFKKPEYKQKLNRLKFGKSFNDLQLSLSVITNDPQLRRGAVSHFLDIAIDSGIVVPITCYKNNTIYRAYRHGEDVVWGENNDRLIGYLFESYKAAHGENISQLIFEKLFVIFLKIGLQKSILHPYDYDTSPSEKLKLVSVRSFLYGQVTVSHTIEPHNLPNLTPIIDNDDRGSWTFDRLKQDKFISSGAGDKYTIDSKSLIELYSIKNPKKFDDEPSDYSSQSQFTAEEVGDTFGILMNEGLITNNDLVLFTSCLNPHDNLNSIAAEIDIFNKKWSKNMTYLLENPLQANKALLEISENLRNPQKNISWTAINSGAWKYRNFFLKNGTERIQQVSDSIEDHFSKQEAKFIKRSWLSMWSSIQDWEREASPITSNILSEMGKWLIHSCFEYYLIDTYLQGIASLNHETDNRVLSLKNEVSLLNGEISSLEDAILKESKNADLDIEKRGEINFDKGTKIRPLEDQIRTLKKQISKLNDKITKTQNSITDSFATLNGYANDLFNIFGEGELKSKLEGIQDLFSASTITELRESLSLSIEKLDELRTRGEGLIKQYYLTVPRWGKLSEFYTYNYALYIDIKDETRLASLEHHLNIALESYEKEQFKSTEKIGVSVRLIPLAFSKKHLIILFGGYNAMSRMIDVLFIAKNTITEIGSESSFYLINKLSIRYEIKWRVKSKSDENDYIDFGDFFKIINHISSFEDEKGVYLIRDNKSDFEFSKTYNGTDQNNSIIKIDDTVSSSKSNKMQYTSMNELFDNVDIGIITIVPPEANAVKGILSDYRELKKAPTNRYYTEGIIKTSQKEYKVAMTKQLSQGNDSVISAYTALKAQYSPKFMILFGIAGGIKDKLKVGDVIIANAVLGYDKSKDHGKEGLTRRGNVFNPTPEMLREFGRFEDLYGEDAEFKSNLDEENFTTFIAPIGSGGSVIGSELSDIRLWLKEFNDKTIAVETEANGFCSFNYEEQLIKEESKNFLIVRGISDCADEDKNTNEKFRRKLASTNAGQVLMKFLEIADVTNL